MGLERGVAVRGEEWLVGLERGVAVGGEEWLVGLERGVARARRRRDRFQAFTIIHCAEEEHTVFERWLLQCTCMYVCEYVQRDPLT